MINTKYHPEKWPFPFCETFEDGWDVERASDEIHSVRKYLITPKLQETIDVLIYEDFREPLKAAIREMEDIINNKDNVTGMYITHISSGKVKYEVWDNSKKVHSCFGKSAKSEEEAEAIASKIPNAFVHHVEGDELWLIMEEDDEMSQHCWDNNIGGDLVGCFDDKHEAELEAAKYEHAYVDEYDYDQRWNVISKETSMGIFGEFMCGSLDRALTFLYKENTPPCWEKLMNLEFERLMSLPTELGA